MKFPYKVKKNGVVYPAFTEIPDEVVEKTAVEEKTADEPVAEEKIIPADLSIEQKSEIVFADLDAKVAQRLKEEPAKEFKPKPMYGKNQIMRMPLTDLRVLAQNEGLENVQNKTGAELKRELIEKFGL